MVKTDRSPVTVADFGSQALVCGAIREAFPDDPIMAEEDAHELRKPESRGLLDRIAALIPGATADEVCRWIDYGSAADSSDRYWTLDPIDGTKGFLRNEQYAVALALLHDGRPVVAAMACPNFHGGVVFSAVLGGGARIRTHDGAAPQLIHVSNVSNPASARLCESVEAAHSSHAHAKRVVSELFISTPPVRIDSQCKYGVLARGEADVYLRLPTKPGYVERVWDHAAGALIVTEAGGRVTDTAGKPLDYSHGRGLEANRGVVATNGRLHDRILAAIEKTRAEDGI